MKVCNKGKVVQVIGPVIDIRFEDGHLPNLLNAVEIEYAEKRLIVEVAQHIGNDVVRCIAMSSTDGLKRGIQAVDTGSSINWFPQKVKNPPQRFSSNRNLD